MADVRVAKQPVLSVGLGQDSDFIFARQRAAEFADLLGMDRQDRTRIATAVSEIARNAFMYAGGGRVEFFIERVPRFALRVAIQDRGSGIAHLEQIWSGSYRSSSGMGLGILGAKRLVDEFEIETGPEGTQVTLVKYIPGDAAAAPTDEQVAKRLTGNKTAEPASVLASQNLELIQLLEALRAREIELERLNGELEETNRGVMVLYSELEDKAQAVQQANEMKSRFLSSVTHELRTPLNSIVSLSRLLLQHEDGDLSSEQDKQVGFILRSAQNMTEMVNDLLDLAKIEAGKISIKPSLVCVADVFSALRGMFRPIASSDKVELRFETPDPSLLLETDEGKLAQILRNFISNGLKFTESGEIVVRAWPEQDTVVLSVADTGIGIAPEHHDLVLQEWGQVGSATAKGQRGSGLGLPLAKRFTELLGGEMWFTSQPGHGSTFFVRLPGRSTPKVEAVEQDAGGTILMVDDDEVWRYLLRRRLEELTAAKILEAPDGESGLHCLRTHRPALLILDLLMPQMSGLEVLRELQREPAGENMRILVVTSKELTAQERELIREAHAEILPKKDTSHEELHVGLERALLEVGLLNLHEKGA